VNLSFSKDDLSTKSGQLHFERMPAAEQEEFVKEMDDAADG